MSSPNAQRIADRFLGNTGSISKTAGEVIFRKDRGGDKNEWAYAAIPPSKREITSDFVYNVKEMKPLTLTLRSTNAALGHIISAHNMFVKIKSAKVSPDGALGGRGYINKIADMRKQYANIVEALSNLSDTLHDEVLASHWHVGETGNRDRQEVQEILDDSEKIKKDPEAWAEGEEAEMDEEHETGKKAFVIKTAATQLLTTYFGDR